MIFSMDPYKSCFTKHYLRVAFCTSTKLVHLIYIVLAEYTGEWRQLFLNQP